MLGLLLCGALLAPATPALAWGSSGDGFGSHDWIIAQAVKVLDGRVSDWFDERTALLASDDPDTVEDSSSPDRRHVYRDVGARGAGVDRIATEYDLAQAAYERGVVARDTGDQATATAEFGDASRHIGLLGHVLGDLSQPFHTAYAAVSDGVRHDEYEVLVNGYQRQPSDMPGWQSTRRTVTAIGDIRATAAGTAAYSRTFYAELHSLFVKDGVRMTPRVATITGLVMERATNDLADIIWSISQGAGAQPQVGSLRVWANWTGVAANYRQTVHVLARDRDGNPIEGLRVAVTWPTATGSRSEILFTDQRGTQIRVGKVGTSPRLRPMPLKARTLVRGVAQTATSWWAITPALGSGARGFRTIVADATVAPGQTARVTSIARDAKGRALPNLLVDWTWRLSNGTVHKTQAITNAKGRASSTLFITPDMAAGIIRVAAHTQAASHNRTVWVTIKRVN